MIQTPYNLIKEKNAHFVKLITKCVVIIYALGSVHEKFGV